MNIDDFVDSDLWNQANAASALGQMFADLLIELKAAGVIDDAAIKRILNANEKVIADYRIDRMRYFGQEAVVNRLTDRREISLKGLHPDTQYRVRSRRSQGLPKP